ncbi:MAG TPA: hypothetical protein VD930_02200 [Gemmatimonadales bacterium]|nr:hypothetical protein [Gemmatimonadales bacterium]
MFIELTDHLRCPEDHDESFLVLLPDKLVGRFVRTGQLGCPVCGRTFELTDGVFDTGSAPHPAIQPSSLTGEAVSVLAGLSGPGGYLALVGPPASLWGEIAERMPGVALVAVNPASEVTDGDGVSVIRSGRIPLKSRSLRGVVLGRPYAEDPYWVGEAARVVLPGLRLVGEGSDPPDDLVDIMASTGATWVGTVRR